MVPRRLFLLGLLAVGTMVATGVVVADAGTTAGVTAKAAECQSLTTLDLAGIPGAPTEIGAATVVAAENNELGDWAACDVRGIIAPQIQFRLLLPTETWQGKYLQTGCGGYCGSVSISVPAAVGCVPLTDGAFAVASSNEGHVGSSAFSGVFGTDPTLRVSFGYESEHLLALAAKRIIREFYGSGPEYSYYTGCSQGGHEGLTEAQRYPDDFDGVVAGAPASIMTELNVWYQAWNALANRAPNGDPILTTADLGPLHEAALDACDGVDGDRDRLIADPLSCSFDPGTPTCPKLCLTAAQIETARKLYKGPRDDRGRLMYPGWQVVGSELNWVNWLVPRAPGVPTIDEQIVQQTLRYLVHPDPHPELDVDDVRFTAAEFAQITKQVKGIYDATNPDLSAFRQSGGKLILWHGWGDPAISPVGTIAYHQALQDAMGGQERTARFARLFMLPGVSHCSGGEGPDSFDALSAIVAWVERGRAPEKLVASKGSTSRPVYPYPKVAGPGAHAPQNPAKPFDAHVRWLGSFTPGYEQVCGWHDGVWVCRPAH